MIPTSAQAYGCLYMCSLVVLHVYASCTHQVFPSLYAERYSTHKSHRSYFFLNVM